MIDRRAGIYVVATHPTLYFWTLPFPASSFWSRHDTLLPRSADNVVIC